MPYVITEACINTKDKACVDVCPVDCIYEGEQQLFINPDECIDCGACEPECPVTAIFPEEDVPANLKAYVQLNRGYPRDHPAVRRTTGSREYQRHRHIRRVRRQPPSRATPPLQRPHAADAILQSGIARVGARARDRRRRSAAR